MKRGRKQQLKYLGWLIVLILSVRGCYSCRNRMEKKEKKIDSSFMFISGDTLPFAKAPEKKHRIYSVPGFERTFNDINSVQLQAAEHWGVQPVANRDEARKLCVGGKLVYIGSIPGIVLDKRIKSSIPYLVPRASFLLTKIAINFLDSLRVKQVKYNMLIVTSVLRTQEDVDKLRTHNSNATKNSCHQYGTTFDLSYNRYVQVQNPGGPQVKPVRNDTLKWVLSEVLRDLRADSLCYIKYEVNQGCFHITAR